MRTLIAGPLVILGILLAFCAPVLAAEPQWGSLQGRFVYDGEPPVRKKFDVSKEKFCEKHELLDESLQVNPKDRGLANVFVWLRRSKDQELHIHPDRAKEKERELTWKIKDCRFESHAVGVQVGQPMVVKNLDPIGHNEKILLAKTMFSPTISATGESKHLFTPPESQPRGVACAIHPWMTGHILIQDHPYFAITDTSGNFKIDKLPAGEWTFAFWHESFGFITKPKLFGEQQAWPKGRKTIKIKAEGVELGEIVLAPDARQP